MHSFSPIYGVDSTVETAIAARYAENFYNNWILDTAALGEIPGDLLASLYGKCDLSMMRPEDLELIKKYTVDFLGLNYYARVMVGALQERRDDVDCQQQGEGGEGNLTDYHQRLV